MIVLVSFSGCLNFITTREKQACLALTHFSSTSIEDCFSQNSCFKDVDKLGFYTTPELPNDLFSYYAKIYSEGLEVAITYIPSLYNFSQYTLNSISVIDDLNSINDNVYTLKVYNFYQVINSFVGSSNSLLTDFKTINNSYNENLDKVYLKITDVEKNIEGNNSYLEIKDFAYYNKLKKEIKFKEITFGYYLSEIKKINAKVMENKVDNVKATQKYALDLLACDGLVDEVRPYTSIYFKEKIDRYKTSENILEKLKICADINKGLA